MANQARAVGSGSQHFSKAQIAARTEAERMVVQSITKPKMNEVTRNNAAVKKVFNQLKKYNDHYTEADSIALNTLAFNLYMKTTHESALEGLHILDDNYERFLMRIEKFSKQINESMKQLAIPLNARYSLANDMAKVMIEEKKLQQMEQQNQPQAVNPLLAVLEATKNV